MFDIKAEWDRPSQLASRSEEHVLRARLTPSGQSQSGMPVHLAVALDTSGSMKGEKFERAKEACLALLQLLRPEDRMSLCIYSTRITELGLGIAAERKAISEIEQKLRHATPSGVTRIDLALDWALNTLTSTRGGSASAVLITDGHATDPRGELLTELNPLISAATGLWRSGISCYTVGLGSASDFNTEFLVRLSEEGKGGFLYADSPERLEPLLRERLYASQRLSLSSAFLTVKPLFAEVKLSAVCRLRPEYLPIDASPSNCDSMVELGPIRSDTTTDVLLRFQVPPLPFGTPQGAYDIVQLDFAGTTVPSGPRTATMSPCASATAQILYTNSYSEGQQVHSDIDRDRLIWETNAYSDMLVRVNDPNQTVQLLSQIAHTASLAGLSATATQARKTYDRLSTSGKVSAHDITKTLTSVRDATGDS